MALSKPVIKLRRRKPTEEEEGIIFEAAETDDIVALKKLISCGVDVTGVVYGNNWTGLHYAARDGSNRVVSTLISAGADVNATSRLGRTPAHVAAGNGHTNVVAILAANGADMNMKDNSGWTPAHEAAWSGHTNVVAILAANGADMNMKNDNGDTPLDIAVRWDRSGVVSYLVNDVAGIDPTQLDQETQQEIKRLLKEEETSRKGKDKSHDPQGIFGIHSARTGHRIITKATVIAYQHAKKKGTRKSNQVKVVMIGAEGAGKTSSVHSLVDKDHDENQESTVGASTSYCTIDQVFVSKWKQIEMAEQLKDLPERHKSNIKKWMPEVSAEVNAELHSISQRGAVEKVPKEVEDHIQATIDAKEVSDGDVRIVILDLGGQEIYYEIHFLFLAPEDVALLTFDASKGLDEPVVSRQRLNRFKAKVATRGMQTNLEVLETLLQSVYSHCGKAVVGHISKRIPTIIVMATHASGLTDQQRMAIVQKFLEAFWGKPFLDHLPVAREDAFHFVDNKVRDPVVFEKVRKVVLKAAEGTINQNCPISYLEFESELLQASLNKPIIPRQEALDIAVAAGIEQDKLTEVLLHFCYKGVLLYYPDMPALEDDVFVCPQEVADLVSSVISTHDCQPSTADLQQSCVRYDTFGLLEERLLDDLLQRCDRLKQKPTILALLEKFELAVKVSTSTKYFDEDDGYATPEGGRVFVVPSMLVYNEKEEYKKQANDTVVLYHYPDKFLPENVFNHVLLRTVNWCNRKGHHIRRLYRGIGYFDFKNRNQSFKLQQSKSLSSIKCYITIHEKGVNREEREMLEQRQGLLAHLKSAIKQVHLACIPSARYPIGYVECPLQHRADCLPHVRLEDISESGKVYCSKNEGKIVPPSAYLMLLATDGGPCHNDCPAASDTLQKHYDKLIYLPVKALLPNLYAKKVVTFDQKKTIDSISLDTDKMVYILDMIIVSLKANVYVKYDRFIQALMQSSDMTVNAFVSQFLDPSA